ncbi:MAG: hypothetical protein ACFCUX_04075 [Candidatus Methylacidiphilales bacterium]
MLICELWKELSPELNHKILEAACLHDKTLYRKVHGELAPALKKRPKQVLDLPRAERHELYRPLLQIPIYFVLAQNLAINWLGHEGIELLTTFLDALGIEHDGKGCAEFFPNTVSREDLERAMKALLSSTRFSREESVFYLRLFPDISGVEWDDYEAVLEKTRQSVAA